MTTGGSDAIETGAKLIRRYWNAVGRPEKRIIVARELSYHGMNAWGTELGGLPSNNEGYGGPLVPHVVHVPTHDTGAVADLFEREADRIAAFVGEPVIGSGGVVPPVDGYWPEIERLCRAHDVLLFTDEVITGFGRVGRDFGCQHYGFTPDVIAFAKGGDVRVRAPGRDPHLPPHPRTVLERRGRLPPRLHLFGPRHLLRGRPGQPGHHRAGGPRLEGRGPRPRSGRRGRRARLPTRWWTEPGPPACLPP